MKSIVILNSDDFGILQHHIEHKNVRCTAYIKNDLNIVDFEDLIIYATVREFLKRTKIKYKMNKEPK